LYEHRYHSNVALECSGDFYSHIVIGFLQPLLASRIRSSYPVLANHSDEHFRGVDRTLHLVDKIHTWLCQIDVVEDPVLAEVLNEPVCQPSCVSVTFAASVADKNAFCVRCHALNTFLSLQELLLCCFA
jgi:hypothetical protein